MLTVLVLIYSMHSLLHFVSFLRSHPQKSTIIFNAMFYRALNIACGSHNPSTSILASY